ncbi:MAG: bifunctional DNA primase/polymerase [Arcanobacterium sp.]|nr:bifunctional DNA primase/polymerase [Arcanobacterium sp.]
MSSTENESAHSQHAVDAPKTSHPKEVSSQDYQHDLAAAAIRYGLKGWKVLPCEWRAGKYAKAPLIHNGFKAASCDPAVIAHWWRLYPNALIGVAVPPGVIVIDIDPRHGGRLDDVLALCDWDMVRTRATYSGRDDGGVHLWFTTTLSNVAQSNLLDADGKRLEGVDVKPGGSGYVIAAPSLHPETGKPYRANSQKIQPLPAGLIARLPFKHEATNSLLNSGFSLLSARHTRSKLLGGLIDGMARQVEGNRNSYLFWAACRMLEAEQAGLKIDLDELAEAAAMAGLSGREIFATLRSARQQIVRR